MRFWDASAIVPLLVPEERSVECTRLLVAPPLVWALTPVEIVSAIERRARDGGLAPEDRKAANRRLAELRRAWAEIQDLEMVRSRAERLLAVHRLRAADALQLGAALVACEEQPADVGFVCLDRDLTIAAEREGFEVLP